MKKCTTAKQTNCLAVLNQNGQTAPLPPGNVGWGEEIDWTSRWPAPSARTAASTCTRRTTIVREPRGRREQGGVATARVVSISNSYGASAAIAARSMPRTTTRRRPSTVSSGDTGFGLACPAALNTVVAVGGTSLHLNGSGGYVSESAWAAPVPAARRVITAQPWQTTASNWAAIGCGTKRGMADVSAVANPDTGVAVYDSYGVTPGFYQVGGTSLSSPIIASVYALANNVGQLELPGAERLRLAGQPARRDDRQQRQRLHLHRHPLQCHAGAGFDLPTGIGTPNGLGGF